MKGRLLQQRKSGGSPMYELTTDRTENKRRIRTYINTQTNSETKITPIFKDKDGLQWWGFVDLYKIPYIRIAMAKHISDMFTIGLSLKDILEWCSKEKALLRSDEPDKYEKLYAMILEKERLINYTADPVKQHLALCTIYCLKEDEKVDSFNDQMAEEKLMLWAADLNATSFFLNWHLKHIQDFTESLLKTSKIVLESQESIPAQLPKL